MSFCINLSLNAGVLAETQIQLTNTNSERITDLADIFTMSEEHSLKKTLLEIEQKTQAQIAILTLHTLHDEKINPENLDIFQFGIELVSDDNLGWNIGDEKRDTGLLLIIVEQDHKYRFFTGYGLEGALPDLLLKRIAENFFPQSFRQNLYYEGVSNALVDIQRVLEHDEELIQTYEKDFNKFAIFLLFAFSFWAGFFVSEILNKEKKNKLIFGISLGILFTILTPYIFFETGITALFVFILTSSDTKEGGGFSSGHWSGAGGFGGNAGFSSFGGGSFGGGGAGGSW